MLIDTTLFGTTDKIEAAINRLKLYEPEEGYYLAFSGGKDSQCIYHLAKLANVKFDAHYNVTSVDQPELIRFIKEHYQDVIFDYPKDESGKVLTMWNLIPQYTIPPIRLVRYCCNKLKESSGEGRVTVTGVRWAESSRRKNRHGSVTLFGSKDRHTQGTILNDDNDEARRTVENCYRTRKVIVNPIIDWLDEDVWEFLNNVIRVPHCELYDNGYKRLGCIGCPMGNTKGMEKDFKLYPKYKDAYKRAFKRMIETRKSRNLETVWKDEDDCFDWWVYRRKDDQQKLIKEMEM